MESKSRDTNLRRPGEQRKGSVSVYGWGEVRAKVLQNGMHYNQCLQDINYNLLHLTIMMVNVVMCNKWVKLFLIIYTFDSKCAE